jgi:hypothetical protein
VAVAEAEFHGHGVQDNRLRRIAVLEPDLISGPAFGQEGQLATQPLMSQAMVIKLLLVISSAVRRSG